MHTTAAFYARQALSISSATSSCSDTSRRGGNRKFISTPI
jgi:hypothetical protein